VKFPADVEVFVATEPIDLRCPSIASLGACKSASGAARKAALSSCSLVDGRAIVATGEFMAEWKGPLEKILQAIDEAGYTESMLPDLAALRGVIEKIEHHGVLYTPA
jgi:hypothetical protein